MFGVEFSPEDIAHKLLDILKSASESPELAMKETVAEEDYRTTFLKLTRNLAPRGKAFSQIEIGSAVEASPPVVISEASRYLITDTLNAPISADSLAIPSGEVVEIAGILRALDLNKDFIEVYSGDVRQVIGDTGDIVDDVIGPMVNHQVIVKARRKKRGKKLTFVDIERAD